MVETSDLFTYVCVCFLIPQLLTSTWFYFLLPSEPFFTKNLLSQVDTITRQSLQRSEDSYS